MNFALFFIFFLSLSPYVSSECVETEVNFDFRDAIPSGPSCPSSNVLGRTPDPVVGGPPLEIKFGALIDCELLPALSKVLVDSYSAAVDELNALSQAQQSNAKFSIEFENTRLNGTHAAEKLKVLKNRGAGVILGPITSDELMVVGPTAKALGVTTITSTATSVGLGQISSVYRMGPNDETHANTLAHFLIGRGFYYAVSLHRGDSFGIPFKEKFQRAYQNLGGNMTTGVSYNPSNFNATNLAIQLETTVNQAISAIQFGPKRVAVLMISNEEWQDLVAAVRSPVLLRQFWVGSSGVSRVREPKPAAMEFLRLTGSLSAAGIYIPESKLKSKVIKNLRVRGHNNPDPVSYLAYDSVILSGLSALMTRTTKNPAHGLAFATLANYWVGGSGRLKLNSVGDRLYLQFTIEELEVTTGRWKILGVFDSNLLTWSDA